MQQFVFGGGERDSTTGHAYLAPVVPDVEFARHEGLGLGAAGQRCPDPRHEFRRREGLDDVVDGAEF